MAAHDKEITLGDNSFTPAITLGEIAREVQGLANRIAADYAGRRRPLLLGVLNGSFMFASELARNLDMDCDISFIKIASYRGTESTGRVSELVGLDVDIAGRHVIIVEDIVDTEHSIEHLYRMLEPLRPASIEVAALLLKPGVYRKEIPVRYAAFEIPDDFVVGFGLDYDGLGRNLPGIYKIKR